MTKADLIEKMAEATGCTRLVLARHLTELLRQSPKAVKKGDKVALVGFGTFFTFKEESNGQAGILGQESTIKIAASESP